MSPGHPISNATPANPVDALKYENERLQEFAANPPEEIFIVSDFHLGRGRDPVTGRFSRTENFLADEAFARFLDYVGPAPSKLLLINGDTFDFVRLCEHPHEDAELDEWSSFLGSLGVAKTPAELKRSISRTEVRFGLATDDYKSVWKLLQIAKGHRDFLQALANWINRGGRLMLSKGNHDLEMYWPLVREAFCELLRREGADINAIRTQVFYCDDSLLIANVYFEHGHRYDPEQSIDESNGNSPVLPDNPEQLKLPLGIFVNRYLINQLEKLELFLGAVRPTERILWMLLRSHPLAAIGMLFRSLKFIRRAFQASKGRGVFWYAVYLGAVALSLVPVLAAAGIFIFATHPKDIIKDHPWRSIIGGAGLFAPHLAAALREIVKWLERKWPKKKAIGEDDMARGVYVTMQKIKFPAASRIYAVMGHTHDQDIQSLPDLNGAKVLYLNTGTWIPVWPEDRPDLNGQILFPFVHFRRVTAEEYSHEYMEWKDDRGGPAESYILLPEKF